MKATTILISCALLSGAATVQADEKDLGDGTLPGFLEQFDTNNDGRIDEEEMQAMKQLRKHAREQKRDEIDANGDGRISLQERERAREQMQTTIEERRAEKFAEVAGDDDLLSYPEFAGIPAFGDVDPERIRLMFNRLDADGSGEVTLDEFMARLRRHHGDGPAYGDGEECPDPNREGPGGPGGGDGSGPGGECGPGDGSGSGGGSGPGGGGA